MHALTTRLGSKGEHDRLLRMHWITPSLPLPPNLSEFVAYPLDRDAVSDASRKASTWPRKGNRASSKLVCIRNASLPCFECRSCPPKPVRIKQQSKSTEIDRQIERTSEHSNAPCPSDTLVGGMPSSERGKHIARNSFSFRLEFSVAEGGNTPTAPTVCEDLMLYCPVCYERVRTVQHQRRVDQVLTCLLCRRCGYCYTPPPNTTWTEPLHPWTVRDRNQVRAGVSQTLQQPGELVVLGAESAGQETSQVRCERCGARKASFYQLQTRSADEPMTTFYRCLECGAQWRE